MDAHTAHGTTEGSSEPCAGSPGVHAVLTGADIGHVGLGRRLLDWPALATDRVRMVGDRVAAVAAETKQAADDAARLVEVEYADLPLVTLDNALAEDAPVLHPDIDTYRFLGRHSAEQREPLPAVAADPGSAATLQRG